MSAQDDDMDLPWENDGPGASSPAAPAARGSFSPRGARMGAPAPEDGPQESAAQAEPARAGQNAPRAAQTGAPRAAAPAVSPAASYAHNYGRLRAAAQALRQQQEPDLDALIPLVDDALDAYKACKARIDQVKAMLGERLEQLEGGASH
jgi:exodeoxyribonuclease VII small subunit